MSGTVAIRKKISTIEKLRKYYLKGADKVVLTPQQEGIRQKIELAWSLICQYGSYTHVVKILINKGCSQAQAYRYINDSESLFGNAIKNNTRAKQFILEENVRVLFSKALLENDLYLQHKTLTLLHKVYGKNKEDEKDYNPEKFAAQTFIIKADPRAIEIMNAKSSGNAFDFNMMDPEDVDFKEVNEEEDDDE